MNEFLRVGQKCPALLSLYAQSVIIFVCLRAWNHNNGKHRQDKKYRNHRSRRPRQDHAGRCDARSNRERIATMKQSSNGSWTRWTLNASAASRSWRRILRSSTATTRSTSSTLRATPISGVRSNVFLRWWMASCCSSIRPKGVCRRRVSYFARPSN